MSHASHTSLAHTRDYNQGHDKGELSSHAQSASFTSDPLLTPISTSSMPKPIHPDPTPSENPELFDKSTGHANTHYHPDAKLSKKKRAKKLGLGHVPGHAAAGTHAGGRTFSKHEKAAHERADKRDAAIATTEAEHEDDDEEDEDDEEGDLAQEEEQSHKQHHENRIAGSEQGNTQMPTSKNNPKASSKDGEEADDKDKDNKDKEGGEQGDKEKEGGDDPSLKERATNVLSSAQQKVTNVASGVASTVMSTAQSVPLVGTLLSKIGLGSAKEGESTDGGDQDSEKEKGDEGGDGEKGEKGDGSQEGTEEGGKGKGTGGNFKAGKVGGNRETETEAVTEGSGKQAQPEAAVKGGDEAHGKQGAQQGNSEGALDKARSQQGQKAADKMKS